MKLSGEINDEVGHRTDLALRTNYQWCLAVIQPSYISDRERFLSELRGHVKRHDGHFPPDVVLEVDGDLLVFMYGNFRHCGNILELLFGSGPGPNFKPRLSPDISIDAKVGLSQYAGGKMIEDLLAEARKYTVGYKLGPDIHERPTRIIDKRLLIPA